MGLRDTLNNNSAVVTVGAVAILVMALGILFYSQSGGTSGRVNVPQERYFYDLKDKTLYKVSMDTISPSPAPSGGEGVEAFVMTCEDSCGGKDLSGMTAEQVAEQGFFIAYLERMSDRTRRQIEQAREKNPGSPAAMMGMEMMMDNQFRTVSDERWIPQSNPRFRQLQESLMARCPNKRYPTRCFPGQK